MKQVCAIVGFGPGNGLALARAFGGDGHSLALIARSEGKHASSVEALRKEGVAAHFFAGDAADNDSLGTAFSRVRETLGDPTVLIYNAFAKRMAVPSKTKSDDLIADLRTNVGGALAAVHEVLPAMRAAKVGTILFTGGGLAVDPVPQFASVAVGKAALRNLTFSLAKELAPEGVHVATVTICGMVKPGTSLDPEIIAAAFLRLHGQTPAAFQTEIELR